MTFPHSPGKKRLLSAILLLSLLGAGEPILARSIPFPIIFVHGFGETAERWDDIKPFFHLLELQFGGVLQISKWGNVITSPNYNKAADYFFIQFTDDQLGIQDQIKELRRFIKKLHRESGAPRFVLVGFSMGGLTSRAYLTQYHNKHKIAKLVTITSPHQGSNWAYFHKIALKCLNRAGASKDMSFWTKIETDGKKALCKLFEQVSEKVIDIRFAGPAMRDLMPIEKGAEHSSLLAQLAHTDHPLDVQYASVVAQTPTLEEPFVILENFIKEKKSNGILTALTSPFIDFGRQHFPKFINFINLISNSNAGKNNCNKGSGDGAISVCSQDMSQLAWFKQQIDHQEESAWRDTLQRTVFLKNGTRLEIFTIKDHHLAAPNNYELLQRILAGTSQAAIEITNSKTTWGGKGYISGRVNNYLFDVKRMKLERRENNQWQAIEISAEVDELGFKWEDIPLGEEHNEFRLQYSVMSPTGEEELKVVETLTKEVKIESSDFPTGLVIMMLLVAAIIMGIFVYMNSPSPIFGGRQKCSWEEDDYLD